MKNSLLKLSLSFCAVLAAIAVALTIAQAPVRAAAGAAPAAKAATSHMVKSRGPLAVKVDRNAINKGAALKKGSKSRGPGDWFHVNNTTAYVIDIYVDGSYKGAVAPYGDLYVQDSTGGTYVATASAPGTSSTWGPRSFDTPFEWTLTY